MLLHNVVFVETTKISNSEFHNEATFDIMYRMHKYHKYLEQIACYHASSKCYYSEYMV